MEIKQYNPKCCNASKNQKKEKYVQCPFTPKMGTSFCGKHKSYKYTTYLDVYQNKYCKDNTKKQIPENKEIKSINDGGGSNNDSSKTDDLDNISCCSGIVEINLPPEKQNITQPNKLVKPTKTVKKLKLSLKNDEILNNMIKNREIYSNNLDIKLVSTLDYFFDPTLKDFSNTKITNTFKFYKLVYKRQQLMELLKLNKIKTKENKKKLKERRQEYTKERVKSMFEFIFLCNLNLDKLKKIQKYVKSHIKHNNIKYRGEAVYKRNLCVNDSDFNTLDPLEDVKNNEFYSYTDNNKFIYGFHIDSLHELFKRKKGRVMNPYNREYFPDHVRSDIISLRKLKKPEIQEKQQKKCIELLVKAKCVDVFGKIDIHGYHTDISWLYNASTLALKHFYKKLIYYWNHKLGMTNALKNSILPHGDVINANIQIIRSNMNRFKLLDKILDILNLTVSSAADISDRNAGCILVLHALSEISRNCTEANSWLL